MKSILMMVGAVASKKGGLFDNWGHKDETEKTKMTVPDIQDFIEGYIDGLIQVQLNNDLNECDQVIPDMEDHVNTAIDDLDRWNDKWISFKEKKELGMDALSQLTKLTPDLIADIKENCPFSQNLETILDWQKENWKKPSETAALMAQNYFTHVLKMVGMTSESLQAYKDKDFYEFGEQIGEMIKFLITPSDDE